MTPKEQYYLQALKIWTRHYRRPPALHELAAYVGRTRTPVHDALVSLEHKGYVERNEDRRFEVVP
jgi:DNA-binding IclR family transcriptional regulator